eukprot:290365-Heterocapsa_arctica.AAC.1
MYVAAFSDDSASLASALSSLSATSGPRASSVRGWFFRAVPPSSAPRFYPRCPLAPGSTPPAA